MLRWAACLSSGSARVHRLQRPHRGRRFLNRLFDNADCAGASGATRLVDNGAAAILPRRLLGRGGNWPCFQISFDSDDRGCSGLSAPAVQNRVIDAGIISGVPENAISRSINRSRDAPPPEQRRRDCVRRHWRSYRGAPLCSVNAFRTLRSPEARSKGADKVLMRLNSRAAPLMADCVFPARAT